MAREIRDCRRQPLKNKPVEKRIADHRKKAQDFGERAERKRREEAA